MRTISFRSAQSGLVCNGKGDCALDSKTTPPSYECVCEGNRKGPDCVLCKESFTGGNCELECVGTCNEPKGSCICNLTNASQAVCLCNPNFLGGGGDCSECTPYPPGFFGPNCTMCDNAKCGRYGKCDVGVKGNGTCICDVGYIGEMCDSCSSEYWDSSLEQEQESLCSPCPGGLGNPCSGNGFLAQESTTICPGGKCLCVDGFEGDSCSDRVFSTLYLYASFACMAVICSSIFFFWFGRKQKRLKYQLKMKKLDMLSEVSGMSWD